MDKFFTVTQYMLSHTGIEFKDFILGFRQSTFLCTTLKCIDKFRIPFIKSGIPASNLGSSETRNPAKFAACHIMVGEISYFTSSHYTAVTFGFFVEHGVRFCYIVQLQVEHGCKILEPDRWVVREYGLVLGKLRFKITGFQLCKRKRYQLKLRLTPRSGIKV